MKRAVIYIAILAVACIASGIAIGVAIEKSYTNRHLPQIARARLTRGPQALRMQGGRLKAKRARAFLKGRGTQEGKGPQEGREPQVLNRLSQQLDLSEEQKDKTKAILEEARKNARQTANELRNSLRQIKEESNAEISEILSPEQKEKFEQLSARAKRQRRFKRPEKQE
jgi:Spy/CpxP family protein refolding chaperone